MAKTSRASDNLFYLATTESGLPETDKEWDDFFRANHWRGNEYEPDEHPTAGDYAANPGDELRSSPYPYRPPQRMTDEREQTICHDCANYMANGEGDPDHESRFEQGTRELANRGINLNNLAFNDTDGENNRIAPSGNQCFICGQNVDPDTESFHSVYGAPGYRMHLFQPGDRGYHDFGRE